MLSKIFYKDDSKLLLCYFCLLLMVEINNFFSLAPPLLSKPQLHEFKLNVYYVYLYTYRLTLHTYIYLVNKISGFIPGL